MTQHEQRYPRVFEPLKLGPVEVANRIYMSPHGLPLEAPVPGHETHSLPAAEHAYYFAERAAGGVGLIFHSMHTGLFAAQANLAASPELPESIPSYRRVAEMVHEHGTKLMAELWYVSWHAKRWDALGPEAPSLAPSPTQHYSYPGTRYQMRKDDIRNVLASHATAARHLRLAGYDGIELHVSHGALLEYFLSPYHNQRTDEYGGSLENRARFLREALEVTREEAGDAMAVGIRLTADQLLPGGYDEAGAREILEHLVATGLLDFVDLDISVEPEQGHMMSTGFLVPKFHNAERVGNVRPAAGAVPVLATPGRVTSVAEAERLLADGTADMVGIVRGLIAEPELVNKAREGRESESRICIAANHCAGTPGGGRAFACAINPVAAREERWSERRLVPAPRPMRVVVVGGGPAGLEAARIAAARGHEVTLFEERPEIGGSLAVWAELPGRGHLKTLPPWFSARLAELGVSVQTGTRADLETIVALHPDVAFVATGSHYDPHGESGFAPREIPGWDRSFVHTPEAVISGEARLGGRVLVLDEEGYHAAVGVAEIAAAAGAQVELITRKPTIADALVRDSGYVKARLRAAGVTMRTSTYLKEIGEGTATLSELEAGTERTIPVDHVILATMRKPVDTLADPLRDHVHHVYLIGDALAPRSLKEATYEGHRFARVIGEPDMPRTVTEELFRPLNSLRPAAEA